MKRHLSRFAVFLGFLFLLVALYMRWKDGHVVMKASFDGFTIQVKNIPVVYASRMLTDLPGVASRTYLIEAGGENPISTFRLIPTSDLIEPIAITESKDAEGDFYAVRFSNASMVRFRMTGDSFARWF